MATVITVNALERNVGASSVSLTLGEKLNYLTHKKTCILELDYRNPSFSLILESINKSDVGLDKIVPFLKSDAEEIDLINVIKHNSITCKNADLQIIYGTSNLQRLKPEQTTVLIKTLKSMFELIIIDLGTTTMTSELELLTDMNILLVQSSRRYIEKLKQNKDDYIKERTKLLLNNSFKSSVEVIYQLKQVVPNQKNQFLGELPSSNTLVKNSLKGMINIEKGAYAKSLNNIAAKICSMLDINFSRKFRGSISSKEDVFVKEPLINILIKEKICTKEDIERCLKIQEEGIFNA